jgi:hypothetical protein
VPHEGFADLSFFQTGPTDGSVPVAPALLPGRASYVRCPFNRTAQFGAGQVFAAALHPTWANVPSNVGRGALKVRLIDALLAPPSNTAVIRSRISVSIIGGRPPRRLTRSSRLSATRTPPPGCESLEQVSGWRDPYRTARFGCSSSRQGIGRPRSENYERHEAVAWFSDCDGSSTRKPEPNLSRALPKHESEYLI